MHKKINLMVGVGIVAAIGAARPADAALTLTLSETGFAPVTVTDTLNTGALSFFGTYGDFQTNFVAGLSNKLTTPSPNAATLQIQSLNVKNNSTAGTSKTLSLTLTDNGYTFPGTAGSLEELDSSFGGTLTGQVAGDTETFQSSVLSPATTTGLQSYTAPTTDPGTNSFSRNTTPVNFVDPGSFTLSSVTTVTLTAANAQANLSGTSTVLTPVPEPATLSLLAVGGLLTARRRRR